MKRHYYYYPRLELEGQLKARPGQHHQGQFNDNEAVKRLESLLKDEEHMRREMEKTARNMKMELRDEQQQGSLREIELEKLKQRLSTAELNNVKLTKECELKSKIEHDLRLQIDKFKSSESSISDDVIASYKDEIRNMEREKNRRIKALEKELDKTRTSVNKNSTTISIQTEHDVEAKGELFNKLLFNLLNYS